MRFPEFFVWVAVVAALTVGCEPEQYCTNTCRFAYDGQCDDGSYGASSGYCARGTDCSDCGPNENIDPGVRLAGADRPGFQFEYHEGNGEPPPGVDVTWCDDGPIEVCGEHTLHQSGDGCYWGWYDCPHQWPDGPPFVYVCREDGWNGIGCYHPDALPTDTHWEYCEPAGECTCRDGTRFGQTIEFCHRFPVFIHPDQFATCENWYQVQSERYSCGGGPFQCSPVQPPPACDLEIATWEALCGCGELEPQAPVVIGPACQTAIAELRDETLPLITQACQRRCFSGLLDCYERTNCEGDCMQTQASCISGC